MFEHLDLEEDPSYPMSNIQEDLDNLSAPLATWLEEHQANFDSFQADQLAAKINSKNIERRKRREVDESDFQQALCEVYERTFRPRAARRSVNLNDTQVISHVVASKKRRMAQHGPCESCSFRCTTSSTLAGLFRE